MDYILISKDIHVKWSIFKAMSCVKEDFSRALLHVFLVGRTSKVLANSSVTEDGTLDIAIPAMSLAPGAYAIKAVWVKDFEDERRFADKVATSVVPMVFGITEFPNEETNPSITSPCVTIKSNVATYGYDGLSAYEKAVFLGKTTLNEDEWIANLSEMNEREAAIAEAEAERKEAEEQRKVTEQVLEQQLADTKAWITKIEKLMYGGSDHRQFDLGITHYYVKTEDGKAVLGFAEKDKTFVTSPIDLEANDKIFAKASTACPIELYRIPNGIMEGGAEVVTIAHSESSSGELEHTVSVAGTYFLRAYDSKPLKVAVVNTGAKGMQEHVETIERNLDEEIDRSVAKDEDFQQQVDGMTIRKVAPSRLPSTVLDAWELVDRDNNSKGVMMTTYKDRSIERIEKQGQTLVIVYNLADGTQQTVTIDFKECVIEAEFDTKGFLVKNGIVYFKLSDDRETKNYLHWNADGSLSLSGIEQFMKDIEDERQATFDTNEANRQSLFEANEAQRTATFNSKEAQRDKAVQDVEDAAQEGLKVQEKVEEQETKVEEHESKLSELNNKLHYTPTINNSNINSDLDLTDSDGNVLVRCSNGNIATKNFDSSSIEETNLSPILKSKINSGGGSKDLAVQTYNEGTADFYLSDDNGNVLLELEGGNIKTKNFNSSIAKGTFNPWKGKTMLCMGASSIGGQNKGSNYTKYYGYPLRTCEVLEMNLINRMQFPRSYACGGTCYQYNEVGGTNVVYTDLTPVQFMSMTKVEIDYYHFQETRGDRYTGWKFVSYDETNSYLILQKDKVSYTFKIANNGDPLNGLFNLGSSATIQEFIDSGRSDRKGESFENFLLNPNVDLLVISDQASSVDAVGQIDSQIVPLMRRGTLQNPHYYYSDGVLLADRRNSNCGSILFLIDKFLSNNPNGRVIYCQDGMQPINGDGRDEFGVLKNSGYKRFQWTAFMCAKFGIPFLAHSTKIQQTYLTKDVWIAPDNIHPSDECFKIMGEMFAGELLAGTNDISFMMYNFQLNE